MESQAKDVVEFLASLAASHATAAVQSSSIKLHPFDPAKDDVEEWIERYVYLASEKSWDEQKMAVSFATYLTGTAESWFFQTSKRTRSNWKLLLAAFRRTFLPINPSQWYQDRLDARKQHRDEPVQEFAIAIASLCKKVDINATDAMKAKYFIRGLLPYLMEKMIPVELTTFDEAVQKARMFEYAREAAGSSMKKPLFTVNETTQPDDITSIKNDLKTLVELLKNQAIMNSNTRRTTDPLLPKRKLQWTSDGRPICLECNKAGHIAKDCELRKTHRFNDRKQSKNEPAPL
jgi:hypothetical protein